MRVALLGDYIGLTTGYGQNNLSMALELKKRGHDVANFAFQYNGLPITVKGITIYPTGSVMVDMTNLNHPIHHAMKKFKPDVVLHHSDNWRYTEYSDMGTYHLLPIVHAYNAKLVNYTPIQSFPMPPELEATFTKEGDYTLTMTKYSLNYLKEFTDNADYLYHGVREEIRRIDMAERPWNLPIGNMILDVGNSGDYRKMGPLVLKAFKDYYMNYDRAAYLFMQMQIREWFGLDLHIHHMGMQSMKDHMIFSNNSSNASVFQALTIEDLNKLYNAASAYITLSAAEGFGMTEMEAATLGLPTLVTDFPIHRELLSVFNNVEFVKAERIYPHAWGFEWLADTDDAVAKLCKVHDRDFKRAEPYIPEIYKWPNIVRKLETILEKV